MWYQFSNLSKLFLRCFCDPSCCAFTLCLLEFMVFSWTQINFLEKCRLNLVASFTLLLSYFSFSLLKSLLTGGMLLLCTSNMVSMLLSNIFLFWLLLLLSSFSCGFPFENCVQLCWIFPFVNFMKES